LDERRADPRRTSLLMNMRLKFRTEISKGGEDWIRSCFPQSTKRCIRHYFSEFFEE
jgi:hypothetical protein